jgi:hypothetical protein
MVSVTMVTIKVTISYHTYGRVTIVTMFLALFSRKININYNNII